MSTLFISYSKSDRSTAEVFYDKLVEMGYEKPFRYDHPDAGIPAGSDWERELYGKMKLCNAVIVLCSQNWLNSKWCFAELVYAKAIGKEIFPVLIDETADLPPELGQRQLINFMAGDIWERLQRGLSEADLAPQNDFAWPLDDHDRCPYPGLSTFEAHHAGVYFGRDDEILELREQLNQMRSRDKPRFLFVVGASGSGKSSLLRAGLLPRLTQKDTNRWCVLRTFRWNELRVSGRDWTEQLAVDLVSMWPNDPSKPDWRVLHQRFSHPSSETAANAFISDTKDLMIARQQPNAVPLIAIDQFEELLSTGEHHLVTPFLDFLGRVMTSPQSPWRGIATVRTDFLTAIQTRAELIEWKDQTNIYSLSLMKSDRFYDVIRRPAEKVGVTFESNTLVDQIVHDTATNDALPLLAFTLRELYDRYGRNNCFTEEAYHDRLGGLESCIKRVADEIVDPQPTGTGARDSKRSDTEESKEIEQALRLCFTRHLVQLNDGGEFVRKPAKWHELPAAARPMLDQFIEKRLIVIGEGGIVEVAHEAIFRVRGKLATWLEECGDILRWRRHVSALYTESQNPLLSGTRLAEAKPWRKNRVQELTPEELRLIDRSIFRQRARWGTLLATVIFVIGILTASLIQQSKLRQAAEARVLHSEARVIVDAIGNSANPLSREEETEQLWIITEQPPNVRVAILTQFLETPGNATRLNRRLEYVTNAVVGLDPKLRQHVLVELLAPQFSDPSQHSQVNLACANLAIALAAFDDAAPESDATTFNRFAADTVRNCARRTRERRRASATTTVKIFGPDQITVDFTTAIPLAEYLVSSPDRLRSFDAESFSTELQELLQSPDEPFDFFRWVPTVIIGIQNLPDDQCGHLLRVLTERLRDYSNLMPPQQFAVTAALSAIARRLSPTNADTALQGALTLLPDAQSERADDHETFQMLAQILHSVDLENVSAQGKTEAVQRILDACTDIYARQSRVALIECLDTILRGIRGDDLESVFAQLVSHRPSIGSFGHVGAYAEVTESGVQQVLTRLQPESADYAAAKLDESLQRYVRSGDLDAPFDRARLTRMLVAALSLVPGDHASDQFKQAYGSFWNEILNNDGSAASIKVLCECAASRSGVLESSQRERLKSRILSELNEQSRPHEVVALVSALVLLVDPLQEEDKRLSYQKFLELFENGQTDVNYLDSLEALPDFLAVLSDQECQTIAAAAVGRLGQTEDAAQRLALTKAVAGTLPPSGVEEACLSIIDLMETSGDPYELVLLARCLTQFDLRMGGQHTNNAQRICVQKMKEARNTYELSRTVDAWTYVRDPRDVRTLVSILKHPTCCQDVRTRVLKMLEMQLSDEHGQPIEFDDNVWNLVSDQERLGL